MMQTGHTGARQGPRLGGGPGASRPKPPATILRGLWDKGRTMTDDVDALLAFRAVSGEWADRARAEAKAAIAAFNERTGGATTAAERLIFIVDHMRDAGNRTLDGIQALLDRLATIEELPDIESDHLIQLGELAEEIVALQREMSDLVRATSAIMQAGLKRDPPRFA
jgi:hypothetical protein